MRICDFPPPPRAAPLRETAAAGKRFRELPLGARPDLAAG